MKIQKLLIFIVTVILATSCAEGQKIKFQLQNAVDSASYGLGLNISTQMKSQGIDLLNPEMVAQAIKDMQEGNDPLILPVDANNFLQTYVQKQRNSLAAKSEEAGKKFLEENKKKDGVITLPSGLQYKIITEGTGPKPLATDKVTTHYHGTLIDGTVFDSSVDRGTPATFPVNGVIKGWVEALQLMPVGSKWILYIPSNLAYGQNPRPGGPIKPGDALIFEIELISIQPK